MPYTYLSAFEMNRDKCAIHRVIRSAYLVWFGILNSSVLCGDCAVVTKACPSLVRGPNRTSEVCQVILI